MKSRNELAIIAANASDQVRSIDCTPQGNSRNDTWYTYKAPADLARTLQPGDFVVVERARERGGRQKKLNQSATTYGVMVVRNVHDVCMLDEPSITYKWAFAKVDPSVLRVLLEWEDDVVDRLQKTQRKRARDAMLEELGAEANDLPALPASVRSEVEDAVVVEDEDDGDVVTGPGMADIKDEDDGDQPKKTKLRDTPVD